MSDESMDVRPDFSKNVRILLARQRATGKDLAEAVEVAAPTVYSWLKGETLPGPRTMGKVAAFLHVPVGTLFSKKVEL